MSFEHDFGGGESEDAQAIIGAWRKMVAFSTSERGAKVRSDLSRLVNEGDETVPLDNVYRAALPPPQQGLPRRQFGSQHSQDIHSC
jgi:hypothetical protein